MQKYLSDKTVEKEFEEKFYPQFFPNEGDAEYWEEKTHWKEVKKFILSQRQKDREAIREGIGNFTVYYRSKYSPDCSREETEKEKSTEMIELTDLLSFLDGLEGE